jgi:hypothetical protein
LEVERTMRPLGVVVVGIDAQHAFEVEDPPQNKREEVSHWRCPRRRPSPHAARLSRLPS